MLNEHVLAAIRRERLRPPSTETQVSDDFGFGKDKLEPSWLAGLSLIPAELEAAGRTPCAFSILDMGVIIRSGRKATCQWGCLSPLLVKYLAT